MSMYRINYCLILFISVLLTACYNHGQQTPDAWDLSKQQIDSISFSTTHHYSQNYNFVVNAESLPLADQIGIEAFDTVYVLKGDRLVVAEIQTIPTDSVDSVWVKVAHDQLTQGWIHESELLQGVSPDDPISQFIDVFSDTHLLIFMALFVVVGAFYALRRLLRRRAYIVHFNDIDSFYPTLVCILIATSATLYASIQNFGAEQWRHFYFHPSLNPFTLPLTLGLFVASVWILIIVAVAAFEDTLRQLPTGDAFLYFCGLATVCAVDYVVFSLLTLYYIGYLLLIVYVVYAIWCWWNFAHYRYQCGECGEKMKNKGKCTHCGAVNL